MGDQKINMKRNPLEQGLSPHTKAVCRENLALNVLSNSESWKNWGESMARVSEANQNDSTKLSQHGSNKNVSQEAHS